MPKIDLFLEFEGKRGVELIHVEHDALAKEVLAAAVQYGFRGKEKEDGHVFGPDGDEPLKLDLPLDKQGIRHKHRVHVHRCRKIEVTLHFNEITKSMDFPPATTVDHVKKRFVKAIDMSPVDTTEHVLQTCGTTDRPDPDTQIGAIVTGCCELCFNLVPIKRVEG